MITQEKALKLAEEGILAGVVGFETDEVVSTALGASISTCRETSYIDFTSGIAVHACGHNHEEIVNAIVAQATRVLHISDIMRHPAQLELGEWMRGLFRHVLPGEDWSFLYMNSGSESIDSAAKLALKVTGRSKFVAMDAAFHGRTLFASALSRSKCAHWLPYEEFLAPLRANVLRIPASRGSDPRTVAALEQILATSGDEIAALFFEAVQGEGGYMPMNPATAQRLRALTREHGVLMIADEIQSGCGRTGRWFGFEYLGIEPDIVVFGKAVGGGLPLAGVAAPQSTMEKWQPGEHGTTFGGNPIACAAGLAALKIIEREGLVEHAAATGERIKARLAPLVGKQGVADVRGLGLMIGIEFQDAAGQPDYARCEAIKQYARGEGLLLLSCGARTGEVSTDNAAIRLIPALNTPDKVIDQALDILTEAIGATSVLAGN
jgi:4-aminobutyrate aminotransferase